MNIIDSHCHWLPLDIIENAHFFHKGWNDLEGHIKAMEAHGIDQAVLSYPTSDAFLKMGSTARVAQVYNDAIASVVKKFPKKFIGAAVLPVDNEAVLQNELKRATGQLGLRAVSLASSYNGTFLDEPLFLPLYEFAQKHQMPIFVHSQIVNPIGFERVNDPLLTPVIEYIFDTTMCIGKLLMSGILKNYPDVKFVFANFGGALGLLQHRFDATYQMLRSINFVKDLGGNPTQYLKNIYVDTGGDTLSANYQLALDLLGPGHILWGSDWPAKRDVAASINSVKQLGLAASDIEAILGGNAAALLRF